MESREKLADYDYGGLEQHIATTGKTMEIHGLRFKISYFPWCSSSSASWSLLPIRFCALASYCRDLWQTVTTHTHPPPHPPTAHPPPQPQEYRWRIGVPCGLNQLCRNFGCHAAWIQSASATDCWNSGDVEQLLEPKPPSLLNQRRIRSSSAVPSSAQSSWFRRRLLLIAHDFYFYFGIVRALKGLEPSLSTQFILIEIFRFCRTRLQLVDRTSSPPVGVGCEDHVAPGWSPKSRRPPLFSPPPRSLQCVNRSVCCVEACDTNAYSSLWTRSSVVSTSLPTSQVPSFAIILSFLVCLIY